MPSPGTWSTSLSCWSRRLSWRASGSRAAAHGADQVVAENAVPLTELRRVLAIHRIGQLSRRGLGRRLITHAAQHVHHALPAEFHDHHPSGGKQASSSAARPASLTRPPRPSDSPRAASAVSIRSQSWYVTSRTPRPASLAASGDTGPWPACG